MTDTAFLYPSTASILRTAGIGIIGHGFTTDAAGRECFLLHLDTPVGAATLCDDVEGVMQLQLQEADLSDDDAGGRAVEDPGVQALAAVVEGHDAEALASALDDLLTAATTAFRAGLDVHKEGVAVEVTTDLAVLVAESAEPMG